MTRIASTDKVVRESQATGEAMLQHLGRFSIIRQLGRGAMGEVYLGLDPAIGREVALKTIRGEAAQGAEARERFAREARAAGTLNHPNLVTIHEFGEDQGVLYLAMEYVPGSDLGALFQTRALTPPELLEVLAQVCEGLAYAHGRGVVHRDIKPSNIRVQREGAVLRAKVMDFGVARMEGSDLTSTGTVLGTFGYMAPEYIQTGAAVPASDLFAVGVMLYEGLSGHRPFAGDTTATILYRLVHEDPPPLEPSDLRGVSPRVGALLARALAKDPRSRFPDAAAMARALRSSRDPAWSGLDSDAPTRTLARGAMPPPDRARRRSAAWGLPVLLLAAGLGGWWLLRKPVLAVPASAPGPAAPPATGSTPAQAPKPAAAPAPEPAPPQVQAEPAPIQRPTRPGPRDSRPPEDAPPAAEAQPPGPPDGDAPAPAGEEGAEALNAAARQLLADPEQSLATLDQVLADHPRNPRARALKLAALYRLHRDGALHDELAKDRELGLEPSQFLRFGAFQALLREERRDRRLPPEDRRALMPPLRAFGRRPWRDQGPSGD